MMDSQKSAKEDVRHFYDQVGWQLEDGDHYQNAHYEDLRPVAQEYIQRCHMRVKRHLKPDGKFLLDAGSGPIQYPEYLTYSEGYQYRVCADISIVALKEARKRTGQKGLMVVADVANLPFKDGAFEGIVSLHTFHHLALEDQARAYDETFRVLAPQCTAVVVNGWSESPLMKRWNWVAGMMNGLRSLRARLMGKKPRPAVKSNAPASNRPVGTFTVKNDPAWLKKTLAGRIDFEILVWRSLSVNFLRAVFHEKLGGRRLLRWVYRQEERNPNYCGENGQYPMVVIHK
ncbi:methylase [Longilinea arvoryzae]|uniref:Methylase n=1 Tax=Longilinea arvoryzae TaxID=360412 RepID=A0A0S7BE44_9CHLR|nr:class I SAM-dependent methyltransferase [Longilinea arvoryzae]GAP13773.1 methylase [Longilinea arvoryzae]